MPLGNRKRKASTSDGDAAKKMRLDLLTEMKITTVKGNIEHQKVDAIVCAVDNSLNMGASGTVARKVLSVGGETLMTECKSRFPSGIKYGEVISIGGGKLECKKVYLTALPEFATEFKSDNTADRNRTCKVLHEVVLKIMDMAIEDGLTSLALSAFGTSQLNISVETVAKTFFDAVEAKILESECLIDVRFVLHDQNTFQIFENIGKERPYLSDEDAKMMTDRLVEAHIKTYPEHLPTGRTFQEDVMFESRHCGYRGYLQQVFSALMNTPFRVYVEYHQSMDLCLDERGGFRDYVLNSAIGKPYELYNGFPDFSSMGYEDKYFLVKSSIIDFILLLNYRRAYTKLIGIYHMADLRMTIDDKCLTGQYGFVNTLHDLNLSLEELVLMRCFVATFKDLQNPKLVENIQLKLIQCLRWVAKKNGMNAEKRPSKIVDILTALRKIIHITRCKYGRAYEWNF